MAAAWKSVAGAALILAASSAHAEGMSAWMNQLRGMQSAYRVLIKQVETAQDAQATAHRHVMQSAAQAADERYNIASVKRTMEMFGPDSQLVDPCYQVGIASMTTEIKGKTDASALRALAHVYATGDSGEVSAGGVSGLLGATKPFTGVPYAAVVANRVHRHQTRYCTVSEANAGYCTLQANGMQGGDSDFSVHLSPGKTFGWDQAEAATDFVKTVAPVKPLPVVGDCSGPTCRAALAQRRQQEAYMSMSRFSFLRFVESRSTQHAGDAKKVAAK